MPEQQDADITAAAARLVSGVADEGSGMDEIDILLGSDTASDGDALADDLVRADFAWIDQLVRLRKLTGMTQQQVAQAMGSSQSVVSDIETMSSDPRLSSLRRYALAVGAVVEHRVMLQPAAHPLVTPARATMDILAKVAEILDSVDDDARADILRLLRAVDAIVDVEVTETN